MIAAMIKIAYSTHFAFANGAGSGRMPIKYQIRQKISTATRTVISKDILFILSMLPIAKHAHK
jgi:hypothetical protein